jgi:hypothetical protein
MGVIGNVLLMLSVKLKKNLKKPAVMTSPLDPWGRFYESVSVIM